MCQLARVNLESEYFLIEGRQSPNGQVVEKCIEGSHTSCTAKQPASKSLIFLIRINGIHPSKYLREYFLWGILGTIYTTYIRWERDLVKEIIREGVEGNVCYKTFSFNILDLSFGMLHGRFTPKV